MNCIDMEVWNPATDATLAPPEPLSKRAASKKALQNGSPLGRAADPLRHRRGGLAESLDIAVPVIAAALGRRAVRDPRHGPASLSRIRRDRAGLPGPRGRLRFEPSLARESMAGPTWS